MLSSTDLERLIAVKRREIEIEKTYLGLSPPPKAPDTTECHKENASKPSRIKQVNFSDNRDLCERDEANTEDKKKRDSERNLNDLEENIPPDLERYIRRYVGLPVMLKAGEYSPNNPLTRGERSPDDALRGLGEYERRRNTLRKLRQHQYREYLDQQAKKKQEAKEQAEKERREREEKEKEREERERERLEREKPSPERRRSSFNYVTSGASNKVDTGVQVDGVTRPLSVAVQTDDTELFQLSPSPSKWQLTEAERELSPRTVVTQDERGIQPVSWTAKERDRDIDAKDVLSTQRRRSYGDFDERTSTLKRSNRDKLVSDLRHTYMPSIFDADAIQLRNDQAEKDAAARRQFYQQELKNQIQEQQRIREERKSREKMLEQAEMRRIEEQLRMLRVAQEREVGKQHYITASINDNAKDYEHKRTELQNEIDLEQQKLYRATSHPSRTKRSIFTSRSDKMYHPKPKEDTNELPTNMYYPRTKENDAQGLSYPKTKCDGDNRELPIYYPKRDDSNNPSLSNYLKADHGDNRQLPVYYLKTKETEKKTYSTNIPDNSIFSTNYDVDSYLRKNLNFEPKNYSNKIDDHRNVIEKYQSIDSNMDTDLQIPVLRHSPTKSVDNDNSELSEAMKQVDNKWKIPVVQKNILKSMPSEEGKNVNILTQLGSIRRQLQLEQLKLDQMLNIDDA